VLRHSGFTVLTPRNKAEAVAAIERGEFDAAILTYTLPTELVEELAELLRQTCPDCPIICISQEGKKDRRIAPDEVVLAEHGPTALLEALRRTLRSRVQ
jgi:DNA-binding response OmpR family regulator